MPFYMSPQRWEGELKQESPDRGQWQQPADFSDTPHPVPKARSHTKEAQSRQCPQLTFGQPAFLPTFCWAWWQHWVTQPLEETMTTL